MSLQSEFSPRRPVDPTAPSNTKSTIQRVEGLNGPVELRVAPGGYLQVWPRPTPESLRELYKDEFYDRDKPNFLSKVESERPYWDATWSMRRRLMENALAPLEKTTTRCR